MSERKKERKKEREGIRSTLGVFAIDKVGRKPNFQK